jgi:hypothetical protein
MPLAIAANANEVLEDYKNLVVGEVLGCLRLYIVLVVSLSI